MSTAALELEAITDGPARRRDDREWEYEWEAEEESEEFLRRLAGAVQRSARSGTLRRVALAAARNAAGSLGDIGAAIGGAPGGTGARIGGTLGAALGRVLRDTVPQREWEGEFEARAPRAGNPIRRVYPEALMAHLGHSAAATPSTREAEEFLGALIPVAARLVPQAAPAIMRAAPQLARGVAAVARTLRSSPATRPLVQAVPAIVRRTTASLARQAAAGRPVTARTAVRTLAQQTARSLSDPQQCVRMVRAERALDRRYHRQVAGGQPAGSRPCVSCGR